MRTTGFANHFEVRLSTNDFLNGIVLLINCQKAVFCADSGMFTGTGLGFLSIPRSGDEWPDIRLSILIHTAILVASVTTLCSTTELYLF